MPQKQLFASVVKLSTSYLHSAEDIVDRFAWILSAILGSFGIVLYTKHFFDTAIECYVPVGPTGQHLVDYVNYFCWSHGVIPLLPGEATPDSDRLWQEYDKRRRLSYYPWILVMLPVHCVLLFMPHFYWKAVSNHFTGTNLFAVMKEARNSLNGNKEARHHGVMSVVNFVVNRIAVLRFVKEKETGACEKLLRAVGRRSGHMLFLSYLLMKVFAICLDFIQLVIIQHFLGFYGEDELALSSHGFGYGASVMHDLLSGSDWPTTMIFPRTAYCYIPDFKLVGTTTSYVAQCALPQNMLHEKIYILLWFAMVLLIMANSLSLILWLVFGVRKRTEADRSRRKRLRAIPSPIGCAGEEEAENSQLQEKSKMIVLDQGDGRSQRPPRELLLDEEPLDIHFILSMAKKVLGTMHCARIREKINDALR